MFGQTVSIQAVGYNIFGSGKIIRRESRREDIAVLQLSPHAEKQGRIGYLWSLGGDKSTTKF